MAGVANKRVHGPFAEDEEVRDVVDHLKAQAEPDYLDTVVGGDGEGTPCSTGLAKRAASPTWMNYMTRRWRLSPAMARPQPLTSNVA